MFISVAQDKLREAQQYPLPFFSGEGGTYVPGESKFLILTTSLVLLFVLIVLVVLRNRRS